MNRFMTLLGGLLALNQSSHAASLPRCEQKIDQFCKNLYEPKNPLGPGNMDLKVGTETIKIRLGRDKKDNRYSDVALVEARVQNTTHYPLDFQNYLKKYHYAEKAKAYLELPESKTLSARRISRAMLVTSNSAWNYAFDDTVDDELDQIHPHFTKQKYLDPSWEIERQEIEKNLQIKINRMTWQDSPHWKAIQKQFKQVQETYLEEIRKNPKLSAETKLKWANSISTVQLKIPGTEDFLLRDADCATRSNNGYYNDLHHSLTVCAGSFNTDAFLDGMAHELAHSIGEHRHITESLSAAPIGQNVMALGKELCQKHPVGCSPTWQKIKADLTSEKKMLAPLEAYKPEAPVLRECLQYSKPKADGELLKRIVVDGADTEAHNLRSSLAEDLVFLTSVKPTTINPDGKVYPNPSYLNPCGGKPWSIDKFDPTNALLVFYLAEYQCNSNPDLSKRMAESITVSEQMQRAILEKTIPMGGKFSINKQMISSGFSSNVEEHFADWVSSEIYAQILKKQNLDPESRLNEMASDLAFACDPPSIVDRFPEEAQMEKTFDDEPHSLHSTRRNEIMSKPILAALECAEASEEKAQCTW